MVEIIMVALVETSNPSHTTSISALSTRDAKKLFLGGRGGLMVQQNLSNKQILVHKNVDPKKMLVRKIFGPNKISSKKRFVKKYCKAEKIWSKNIFCLFGEILTHLDINHVFVASKLRAKWRAPKPFGPSYICEVN